jgi:hypothetical protein
MLRTRAAAGRFEPSSEGTHDQPGPPGALFSRVLVMNKLVLIIILVAFVFIVSYDPKKGKKFFPVEKYRDEPLPQEPECDEKRFLQLQGLTGFCAGQNKEHLGAVISSPLEGGSNVMGYDPAPF